MKALHLLPPVEGPLRLLCLGAHSDDIEIGCGGTLFTLLESGIPLDVTWVVFSAGGVREEEARRSAAMVLGSATHSEIQVLAFRDGFFPYEGAAIKEHLEELKARVDPHLILTHRGSDGHQDHRLVSELTWNTYRDHLVLEYEIPKYDADLGHPNVFVPIDEAAMERKLGLLEEVFLTQRDKRWFTRETFLALLRLRGIESASPTGYAEGFHGRKVVLAAPFAPSLAEG